MKVWQLARDLRRQVYRLTEKFPKTEQYVLSQQIKRSAISTTANIAEGYGRYHFPETVQFCRMARGSLNETIDHFYTALNAEYVDKEEFDSLYRNAKDVEKVLNGYINYLQKQTGKS